MHFYFKRKYGLYIMLFFDTKENNDENWDICLSVFFKEKKDVRSRRPLQN